jgi:uncharacterized protein DUF6916
VLGFRPWAADKAGAATGPDTPGYLLRSSYQRLSTKSFASSRLGAVSTLTLDSVEDLVEPSLKGSEDAFALEFSSAQPIEPGIHTFAHPDLGIFDLFVAPVGPQPAYEAVVNRSVGAPKHAPKPPAAASTPPTPPKPRLGHVRRVTGRRLARAVMCEIVLAEHAHVKSAVVWLLRGDRVVAAKSVRRVHGRRIGVRLPFTRRPRGGRYKVIVATKDRSGDLQFKDARLNLL